MVYLQQIRDNAKSNWLTLIIVVLAVGKLRKLRKTRKAVTR